MRLTVLGVKRVYGTSKEGNPFDMTRLIAMVPIEAGGGKNVQVSGYGYEVAELNLDPAALGQFAQVQFPRALELTVDSKPFRGKFETVVTGFLAPAKVANA